MKTKLVYLIACLMAASAASLTAQDKSADRPSREEMREKLKKMTPEEREQKIKEMREKHGEADPEKRREEMKKSAEELGLNVEELRNLSPEERRDKYQQAADAKIAELTKKKAEGKITDEESKLLQKLENRKKAIETYRNRSKADGQGRPDGKGKPDGQNKPERRERPDKK